MFADAPTMAASALEEMCREELRDAFCAIPSRFARIIAILSLRKLPPQELVARYGAEVLDRSMAHLHLRAFCDWLSLNLRQQTADMSLFEAALSRDGIPGSCLDVDLRACEPAEATPVERQLFEIDFALANQLLFCGRSFELSPGESHDRMMSRSLQPFMAA